MTYTDAKEALSAKQHSLISQQTHLSSIKCASTSPVCGEKDELSRLVSKPIAFPSSLLFSQRSWYKNIIPGRVSLTKALNKIIKPTCPYRETKYNADVMHLANLTYVTLPKQIPPVTHQRNTFPRYCLSCLVSLSLPQASRRVNRHSSKSHHWKDQKLNWGTVLLAACPTDGGSRISSQIFILCNMWNTFLMLVYYS